MLRRDRIIKLISTRWGASDVAPICIRIVEWLADQPKDQAERLTFSDLARLTGVRADNDALQQAISVLSGRFRVLRWNFVYFNDEGFPHYLSNEEAEWFLSEGKIGDPDTGELVEDAAAKVRPYFSADPEYLREGVD